MSLLDFIKLDVLEGPQVWNISEFDDLEFAFFHGQPSEPTEFYGWSKRPMKVGDILNIPAGKHGRAARLEITHLRRPGTTEANILYFGTGLFHE